MKNFYQDTPRSIIMYVTYVGVIILFFLSHVSFYGLKKKTKVYLLCMCILITTISCPSSSFYCLINNRHHSTIKSNWWCCYCSCCWWWWWWFNTSWYEQTILFDLKYILSSFCPYIKLGFIVIRIYTISSKSSVDRL